MLFFRTSDGHEVDLLLEHGGELSAIEVKLTTAPKQEDMARLQRAADLVGAGRRFLVSQAPRVVEGPQAVACNLPWLLARLTSDRS